MTATETSRQDFFQLAVGERAEVFRKLSLDNQATLVRDCWETEDLEDLDAALTAMPVPALAALLHDLDLDICRGIFDRIGPTWRLDLLHYLVETEAEHDLYAAINSVSAGEMVRFLQQLPADSRLWVFQMADGSLQVDILLVLHERGFDAEFTCFMKDLNPADAADLLEAFDGEERDAVFHMLTMDEQADALVELETPVAADVIEELGNAEFAALVGHMASDEVVELLNDLDDEDRKHELLTAMSVEKRAELTELLRYEEDSAGEIMTVETCSLPETATVAETRRSLAALETEDPIHYVYVTDPEDGSLTGVVSLISLVKAEPDARLADICNDNPAYTTPDEDQEEVARKFRKYDLWVMPVVDNDRHLIGRITVDDIMDVVKEEADEDLARMVGAPDIEDEEDAPLKITRKRLPWLMITLFAGLINSVLIKTMMDVTTVEAIAIFVPAILAMGGNTGMQSSAVCIRGIALGMEKYRHLRQIVQREIMVGFYLGVACALTSSVTVFLVLTLLGRNLSGQTPLNLATIVGVAMFNAMVFASCFGSLTPILLHRLGADPAVASGPFVTTSNDLSASLIYFLTCVLLLSV